MHRNSLLAPWAAGPADRRAAFGAGALRRRRRLRRLAELRQLFRTQLRARTLTYRERIERLQSRAPKATHRAVFRAQASQAITELQHFQHAIDDWLLN